MRSKFGNFTINSRKIGSESNSFLAKSIKREFDLNLIESPRANHKLDRAEQKIQDARRKSKFMNIRHSLLEKLRDNLLQSNSGDTWFQDGNIKNLKRKLVNKKSSFRNQKSSGKFEFEDREVSVCKSQDGFYVTRISDNENAGKLSRKGSRSCENLSNNNQSTIIGESEFQHSESKSRTNMKDNIKFKANAKNCGKFIFILLLSLRQKNIFLIKIF